MTRDRLFEGFDTNPDPISVVNGMSASREAITDSVRLMTSTAATGPGDSAISSSGCSSSRSSSSGTGSRATASGSAASSSEASISNTSGSITSGSTTSGSITSGVDHLGLDHLGLDHLGLDHLGLDHLGRRLDIGVLGRTWSDTILTGGGRFGPTEVRHGHLDLFTLDGPNGIGRHDRILRIRHRGGDGRRRRGDGRRLDEHVVLAGIRRLGGVDVRRRRSTPPRATPALLTGRLVVDDGRRTPECGICRLASRSDHGCQPGLCRPCVEVDFGTDVAQRRPFDDALLGRRGTGGGRPARSCLVDRTGEPCGGGRLWVHRVDGAVDLARPQASGGHGEECGHQDETADGGGHDTGADHTDGDDLLGSPLVGGQGQERQPEQQGRPEVGPTGGGQRAQRGPGGAFGDVEGFAARSPGEDHPAGDQGEPDPPGHRSGESIERLDRRGAEHPAQDPLDEPEPDRKHGPGGRQSGADDEPGGHPPPPQQPSGEDERGEQGGDDHDRNAGVDGGDRGQVARRCPPGRPGTERSLRRSPPPPSRRQGNRRLRTAGRAPGSRRDCPTAR